MDQEIKVIYEDKDMMVVDKPAGLVTTKERKNEENTLEDWLRNRYQISDIRYQMERAGIVHRLDKGTSGLILVAKNQDSFLNLKKQFKDRLIKKKYMAMICGDVSETGEMNVPIGRSKYGFSKFAVSIDGKKAVTRFRLLSKYENDGKIYSLVEIDLLTGRTHQIRVHFSYLRWPLLGDKLYGGIDNDIKRPFLHAFYIKFIHPTSHKEMVFESMLPSDLKLILKNYEKVS